MILYIYIHAHLFTIVGLPCFQPLFDSVHITLHVIHCVARKFHDDFRCIRLVCCLQNNLHDFTFHIFVNFTLIVSSVRVTLGSNTQTRLVSIYLFTIRSYKLDVSARSTSTRSNHLSGKISQVWKSTTLPPSFNISSNSSKSYQVYESF